MAGAPQEKKEKTPLSVDALKSTLKQALMGTEPFWQQFDLFELSLSKFKHSKEDNRLIAMHVEFHFPPNTPTPALQNVELGNLMNTSLGDAVNRVWPGLFKQWESGFGGGNARGSDLNFFGILGPEANKIVLPADDGKIELYRYEKPADEPRNRPLSARTENVNFDLIKDGPIVVVSPEGAMPLKELRKASKGHLN